MQISCGIYPEIPTKGALGFAPQAPGRTAPGVGEAQGERNRGRAPDGRPCAYADLDSAEILGIAGDGVHEGEERHPHCANLWRETPELCGAALLGAGLLGFNGWAK